MCPILSRAAAAVMLLFGACLGVAQTASGAASGLRQRQPYTAEFKITSVQTLADGTTITREATEVQALDSEGRSLRSTTEPFIDGKGATGTRTNVNDPVSGVQTNWDSRTKTARVIKLPPQENRQGCWANESGNFSMARYPGPQPGKPAPNGTALPDGSVIVPAQHPKPEFEDLGTTTIQGIEVHGRRLTRTMPAGEMGNDRPIVSVSESWSSAKLGLTLREISDDPRSGRRTRELVSLALDEPDPALFQPPEGYAITTEELHEVACPPPHP